MTKGHGECRQQIEDVRRWLESLAQGVAEREIDDYHRHYDVVLTIRPRLNPDGASFELGFVAGE